MSAKVQLVRRAFVYGCGNRVTKPLSNKRIAEGTKRNAFCVERNRDRGSGSFLLRAEDSILGCKACRLIARAGFRGHP